MISLIVEFAPVVSAISALGLFVIAVKQVPNFFKQLDAQHEQVEAQAKLQGERFIQEIKWETFRAVLKFEHDPVIVEKFNVLLKSNSGNDKERDYTTLSDNQEARFAARCILNYFDTLAIGVEHKFYIEDIIKDHFEPIVLKLVCDAFLLRKDGSVGEGENRMTWKSATPVAPSTHFHHLLEMYKRWYPDPEVETHFKG